MTLHDDAGGAASGATALGRCTALGLSDFASTVWSRHALLTRAAGLAGGFTDLLSAAAVDELVSARGLRTPFLRMAKEGTVLSARDYTRGGGAGAGITDQAADDRVLAQFADGATLVLQGLHRTWPPLVDFGSRLAAELGHPVQINAYVTPPQNRGFAPHYDVHDVFVLQVSGRKHWRIHEPVVTDPLESQNWERNRDAVTARAAAQPVIDAVLDPGDALYLPRGTIHAAEALGETSIHITVGVHPVTRHDLVRRLVDLAEQDVTLRASLPMGVDLSDPDVLAPHLAETVAALRAHLDDVPVGAVAQRIGDRLTAQTRPAPIGPLAQLEAAGAVSTTTPLRLRGALRSRLVDDDGLQVLTLIDRTIRLPAESADAVKVMLSGLPFRPGELPGLDVDAALVLCRRLLREGVVVADEGVTGSG